MTPRRPPPDEADRLRAVRARGVNVLADAGAGTGKTTLLVARLVELVAPADDGPALPLERVAAITFTRKAAGELRLRIREALLRALARDDLTALRRGRLAGALAALDTAHVGTIHSFADRLLRLRPVEAGLSPAYEIVEDDAALVAEAYAVLLQAVEAGTLADELAGRAPRADAEAAQAAFLDALRAGLLAERRTWAHGEDRGLDCLVEALVRTRDVRPRVPPAAPPDLGRFRQLVDEYAALAARSAGEGRGSRWVAETRERLARARDDEDPVRILKALRRCAPPRLGKRDDFGEDAAGWDAYQAYRGDTRARNPVRARPLHDDLTGPFARWLARRLVAAAPVVAEVYERVKARHRAVDQVDLLLRLRDLLRDRRDVRAEYQALLDHVLVDELQDTDPLQAEIVVYLCEQGAVARDWREAALVPGKLTIVGDPKQSIYRFRRADIAVYAEVRALVARGPHLVASLRTSFRSEPGLVAWLNGRFDEVLGAREAGRPAFDPDAGTVANEPLAAGREGPIRPCVTLLPLASEDRRKPTFRAVEARALATWLRALVEGGRRTIVDPLTGAARPVRYGDVAVLAWATPGLPLLFPELDRLGVPYAARGGTLFLGDPLHRQFLLGLRALADRDDGVAQAALLRPPFFALDLDDLARARAADEASTHPGVLRARAARALVHDLRRRRLERPPGATARELLERTAFGRAVALGPNGAQRLDALRELCLAADALAAAEGLDFDAATARLRAWAEEPVALDPPRPVASEAVQLLTVHQAKGLEFPVVVLWDACAALDARDAPEAFRVDRTGAAWALHVDGLRCEEPEGGGVADRERRYLDAERRRLVYVAATRARDLLVLPVAGPPEPTWITGLLAAVAPPELVETLEPFVLDTAPARPARPEPVEGPHPACPEPVEGPHPARPEPVEGPHPARPEPVEGPNPARPEPAEGRAAASTFAANVSAAWQDALAEAARPRFAPAAVSAASSEPRSQVTSPSPPAPAGGEGWGEGADAAERPGEAGPPRPPRRSRFGPLFGETVHLAIGLALREAALPPLAAVERASAATGLAERRAEAAEDVARALAALERAGLRRRPGPDLQLEYPVALARDGRLLAGYVDLLAASGAGLAVVDFKTDAPPEGDVAATHAAYVEQVRSYATILEALGLAAAGTVRAALLFTAEGELRWVER